MLCKYCGTELPEQARFCWQCGQSQSADPRDKDGDWETCEIACDVVDDKKLFSSWLGSYDWFRSAQLRFWARATGPQGEYNAGETEPFKAQPEFPPLENDDPVVEAHRNFVVRLIEDGWEPTGKRGDTWYSHRFRRRLGNT